MTFITPTFELYQNEKGNHYESDCPRPSRKSQFILVEDDGLAAILLFFIPPNTRLHPE